MHQRPKRLHRENAPVRSSPCQEWLIAVIAMISVVIAVSILLAKAWVLLNPGVIHWDTPVYWAMGRSILNGLTLYRDIFEVKPPGIFFLSALSLWLVGNGMLGALLGSLTVLLIPAMVTLALHRCWRYHPLHLWLLLPAFLASTALTLYHVERAGGWQTELFGGLFAVAYAVCVFAFTHSGTLTSRRVILLALLLALSAGFKEPFLLSSAASALLTAPHLRIFLKTFLLPTCLAAVGGLLLLTTLGSLPSFFTLYLPAVLLFRTGSWVFDPFWMRGLYVVNVLTDFAVYSPPLPLLWGSSLVLGCASVQRGMTKHHLFHSTLICAAAAYLALLSFGIGGDLQDHHRAFLTPFSITLLLLGLHDITQHWRDVPARRAYITLSFLSVATILATPSWRNDSLRWTPREDAIRAKQAAAAVDVILDRCGVDRYLLLKPKLALDLYGFTKHSPLNHSLFLPIDEAIQYGEDFANISIRRLSEARILVVALPGFTPTNDIGRAMARHILETFDLTPRGCLGPLPLVPGYFVLFRQVDTPLKIEIDVERE